ncbi:MAG: DNA primase [Flavobacteriales bacterium]|nr:DNA primase [Flavobacteriales bacterium]MBP9080168.1 DNA primase [Flavobacteriales bacterium]
MIQPHSIQQVKDAVRIEEVLGDFVQLKRKGPRYLGLCPFHNEKTPSFNVSPQLGIYKCFGCGESGDAISFLQKQEHLSFTEAVRWLAKRYQIELEEEAPTPEQQLEQDERESLAVVQQWALNWSVDQLWNTGEGRAIGLAYFVERGFQEATIKEFQLGYVPDQGDVFAKAALAHGFDPLLLEKAGWVKLREDGSAWDFFRGRVTFPILGLTGQPIAFGARTLKSDKKLPKYFNSPESVLYVKSRSLYGIAQAKKAIVEQQGCLLVEGYTDVISLHQAGIRHAVASSGTSLTVEQVRLIKRYAPAVTVLYDGDAAGIKASLRGIDLIIAEGLAVKVVALPDGDDPDSYARKHSSSEIGEFLRANAKDFLVFKADLLVSETGNDPVKKAAAIHELVESIALVPDLVLRALYVKQCASLLDVAEQALVSELNKVLRRAYRKHLGGEAPPVEEVLPSAMAPPQPPLEDVGSSPQERDLLRLLIAYGEERLTVPMQEEDGAITEEELSVAELMFQSLAMDDMILEEPVFQAIFRDYSFAHKMGEPVDASRYTNNGNEDWRKLSIDLLAERHVLSPNWTARHKIHVVHEKEKLYFAVQQSLNMLKERRLDRMLVQRQELLKDITDEAELEQAMRILLSLQDAKTQLAKITGRVVVG